MNFHILIQKKISIFQVRVPPFGQNRQKKFLPDITIHTPVESPDCVENKNDVLKNI